MKGEQSSCSGVVTKLLQDFTRFMNGSCRVAEEMNRSGGKGDCFRGWVPVDSYAVVCARESKSEMALDSSSGARCL